MISFGKLTKSTYEALAAPVQDRLYLIEDTGELYLNGKTYNGDADGTRDWLCITNTYDGTNTVKIELTNGAVAPSLEYSTDGINWTTLNFSTTESDTITLANGEKVYFRGDNPNYNYGQWDSEHSLDMLVRFVLAEPSPCTGTVASLYSKDCKHSGRYKINNLFENCKITTPPKLDTSDTVQSYDYRGLFRNCTSLLVAPKLPAVNLGQNCYEFMFEGCTSLHVAPELPCTVLSASCYKQMFKNCTALTEAPYLPAMTLATECYANMFEGCTSLSEIPAKLPATTLAEKCYSNMFKNCSSLRKPSVLPATTMAVSCYENMFNATDIREVPELPALDLAKQCYGGMFIGCRNLERIPLDYLQATTMQVGCYQWMFVNCTALKVGCRLPATVMASQCYAHMYDGCTSLVDSERISAETLANGCMNQMFKNCTNLTRLWIPSMTAFDESATPAWMSGLSNLKRAFVCNASLDVSTRNENRIPTGWIPTRNAYAGDAMVPRWGIYSNNITFAPTNSEQDLITVNQNITLNAIELPYGYVGTAQAFINWTWTNVTLTAGEGIDFVDMPRERYLSRVLITWDGIGNAKLRVMWDTPLL